MPSNDYATPKVRDLGKFGIITDVDPYDIPTQAFSLGVNARFRNNRVSRGPVFRNVLHLGTGNPRFLLGSRPTSGLDFVFLGYENGTVTRYASGAESAYSISGYTPSVVEATWTSCHLADVVYINRDDRAPWFLRTSDTSFQNLVGSAAPVGWDSGWQTHLLRACSGSLVALNVTKAGTNYPTMVKTSSFPTTGTIPASWDQTNPATSATENILAEMEGSISDACGLGDNLIIYGLEEAWMMTLIGGSEVWDYQKLPFSKGAINANCSIEIKGRNYVFGTDDIWVHDGVTEQSIADGRVRDFIFSSLNASKANRCFVVHNAQFGELHFCYVSGDRVTGFNQVDGCNRSATYNYLKDHWTFDDLPFVYFGSRANLDNTLTYSSVTSTYTTIGGSYQTQDDSFTRVLCFVGDTNAAYGLTESLYAFDPSDQNSRASFPVDTNATAAQGLYLERDGIDLDELGIELAGYKQIDSIYPEGRIDLNDTSYIQFAFGAADDFNEVPTFTPYMTYDGMSNYKLDFGQAGRYLSMRVSYPDWRPMTLSGFDLDIQITGDR